MPKTLFKGTRGKSEKAEGKASSEIRSNAEGKGLKEVFA